MNPKLQQGWANTTLGELTRIIMGQSPPSISYNITGEGLPFFQGKAEFGELSPNTSKYCSQPSKIARANDILISVRAPVGPTNIATETCCIGRGLAAIRPIAPIETQFIFYYIRSIEKWIGDQGVGSTFTAIDRSFLEKLSVPLPPQAEQTRIINKIEELTGVVKNCKIRLEKIPKLILQFKRAILEAAISGKLTEDWRKKNKKIEPAQVLLALIDKHRTAWAKAEAKKGNTEARRLLSKQSKHTFSIPDGISIPSSWKWSSLAKFCHLVVDCHNKTAPYENKGIYLVRTSNVRDGRLNLNGVRFVSEVTYKHWSKRCPPEPNDILFTREAPMGEAAIIPEGMKVCMGQRMMLLRVFKHLSSSEYLLYALMDPRMQARIDEAAIGSGVKHLRVGDVESLTIPVPPLKEQLEIARRVKALFKLVDGIETRYENLKKQVDAIIPSVLSKAFKGELVPQDLRDEPATVLLEKIKAEKLKLQEEEKKKKTEKRKKGGNKEKPIRKARSKKYVPQQLSLDILREADMIIRRENIVHILEFKKKPVTQAQLFEFSGMNAHDFLIKLQKGIDSGKIIEIKKGNETFYKLRK